MARAKEAINRNPVSRVNSVFIIFVPNVDEHISLR